MFFCICLLLMQNIMELECIINTKNVQLNFSIQHLSCFFHTAAHSAMFSQYHSLLIIYAHRWFIKFVHVITSRTFFFEFTDRPSQKRSQSSFSVEVPWTVYGYVCGVSIAVVQFANMNFSLQLDSNAAARPFVI